MKTIEPVLTCELDIWADRPKDDEQCVSKFNLVLSGGIETVAVVTRVRQKSQTLYQVLLAQARKLPDQPNPVVEEIGRSAVFSVKGDVEHWKIKYANGVFQLSCNAQPVPDESFDFLSYTFGRCHTAKTGRAYVSERPSKTKIQAVCRRISEATDRRLCWRDTEEQVAHLNLMMAGWANYFCQGPVGKPYRIVTRHAVRRLRRWLCRKHKVATGQAITRYPDKYLNRELGLVRLYLRHRNVPWAKA